MKIQIKQSLIALMNGIKLSDGLVIAEEMARLEEMVGRGRAGLHPQLVHFIERRSYAKALMFLEGDTPQAGICGGRAGRS